MAAEIAPADRNKFLYLTQIRFLDEELERCQLRCDELKKLTYDLTILYSGTQRDRDDIYDYLTHSSHEADIRMKELRKQLENQQQADKKQTDALKLQLSQQRGGLQREVDGRRKRNLEHEKMLQQQQEKMGEMMQKLAQLRSLRKEAATARAEQEAAVARLKIQMDLEQRNVLQETENQVKRSIREKVSAAVEEEMTQHKEVFEKVQELTAENRKLLEETAALQHNESELHSDMETRETALHEAAQDIFRLQMEAERLSKTCQQLTLQLNHCSSNRRLLLARELGLRQQLSSKGEQCSQKTAEAAQREAELQEEMSRRRQLEADLQEAANILRPAVMGSEKLSEAQWKKLREILESSASHGTESARHDSPEKGGRGQKPQTSGPGPVSTESLNLATDPLFLLARYRPGDLGFVPRPTWKSKAAASLQLSEGICKSL